MRINIIVAIIATISAVAMMLLWLMGINSVPMGVTVFYVIYIASQSWLIAVICKDHQEIRDSLDARVRSEEFDKESIKRKHKEIDAEWESMRGRNKAVIDLSGTFYQEDINK